MKSALKSLAALVTRARRRIELSRFFALPEDTRADFIRNLYRHKNIESRFVGFFNSDIGFRSNVQFVFDVCAGYATTFKANCIREIGCFALTEARFMRAAGFEGRLEATDFDPDRIAFLERIKGKIGLEDMVLSVQDLGNASADQFKGVDLVVCQAVMSNIQPGAVESCFHAMREGGVKLVVVGDCYSKESLSTSKERLSQPSPIDRNWFHPFFAIAQRTGYNYLFFPDFAYTSFHIARGIFVFWSPDTVIDHDAAFATAVKSYFARQSDVLSRYNKTNINARAEYS